MIETVVNSLCGWHGVPIASPGSYLIGPKWSNISVGTKQDISFPPITLFMINPHPSLCFLPTNDLTTFMLGNGLCFGIYGIDVFELSE